MARLTLINGSPRASGYTEDLLRHFEDGVKRAEGSITRIDLRSVNVGPCSGCYNCWDQTRDGSCVKNDDMGEIIAQVLDCDTLVIATPVYYYSYSAIMKAFLERLLPTTGPLMAIDPESGLERNDWRHPGRGPKTTALIAVGAHKNAQLMEGLVKSFEYTCHALYSKPAGALLRRESFFLDFDAGKPITGKKVRLAFERAGGELVRTGMLSEETINDAALPFTADMKTFRSHSRTYWTIAKEIGCRSFERERLRTAVSHDLRILMPELALCFDSDAGKDLEASIQLTLEEDAPNWYLTIEKGTCTLRSGDTPEPTLNLITTSKTMAEIILQRLDARSALSKGLMKADGSRQLLMRFGRLFPAPTI